MARPTRPVARRNRPPAWARVAVAKARPRPAPVSRSRQDPLRGRGRGAGNDRHVRFRDRAVAATARADDRQRAPAAPVDRAVASAGAHRRDHGVQLPGRGVGVERNAGSRVRRYGDLETLARGAALRDRRSAHRQQRHGGARSARGLQPVLRCERRSGPVARRRQAVAADLGHGQLRDGPVRRSEGRTPTRAARCSSSAATTA